MIPRDDEDKHIVQAPEDALSLRTIELPEGVPMRAKVCITLRAMGLGVKTIAEQIGLSPATVTSYVKKYDPTRLVAQASERRKLYLSSMFETVALEALSGIKSADIQSMNVKDRLALATTCTRAIKEIGAKRPDEEPLTEEDLVSGLKGGIINVDAREIKHEGSHVVHFGSRDSGATEGHGGSAGSFGERDGEQDAGPTDGADQDSNGPSDG